MEKIKNYDIFDITKFIMALMVVAVHVNPLGQNTDYIRYPFLVIAVPIFFLISSYLLFKKIDLTNDTTYLNKYIKRNIKLYFGWFIVLLPFVIKNHVGNTLGITLKNIIVDFILGSTFPASWYIMATVIGTYLIYLSSKKFGNIVTMILSTGIYIVCIFTSSYHNVLPHNTIFDLMINYYPSYSICNSFFVSLLWIFIGKSIAENESRFNKIDSKRLVLGIIFSFIALVLEYNYISFKFGIEKYTCSFVLPLCCSLIFLGILRIKCCYKYAFVLRKMSIIIYCTHIPVSYILGKIINKMKYIDLNVFPYSLVYYLSVVAICISISMIVYKLTQYPKTKWINFLQ